MTVYEAEDAIEGIKKRGYLRWLLKGLKKQKPHLHKKVQSYLDGLNPTFTEAETSLLINNHNLITGQ